MSPLPAPSGTHTSRRFASIIAILAFAGLVLAGPGVSVAAAACPCSLWDNSTLPANETAADFQATELGVRFVPAVDGTITGLRFYQGSQNPGPHTGALWTDTGTLLGTVTFADAITPPGWQQASFSSPVPVTGGQTYVASYHAPNGGYSYSGQYFTSAYTNGPLTALSGANGVFSYGPTSFPTNSFNSTNYWVDVVFNDDLTAPTVTTVTPSSGATGVSTGVAPTATFGEAMDATTISGSTVGLSGPNGAVAGTVAYDPATRVTTFTPSAPLAYSTQYTMTVSTGVTDTAGNHLAAPRTWSFTTEANPTPPGPDTTPPTITAMTPANGSIGAALNVKPTATFSEAMNPASITTTTVQLSGPSGGVSAAVAYDAATRTVTLTPASPLTSATTYTVLVKGKTKGVADVAGNTLASNQSWSFTTVDTVAPVISAIAVTSSPSGTAVVSWTTNEPSTTRVDYGTDPASLSQNVSNATKVTSHSIQISGLTSGVKYYFRVTSADATGNSATSPAPPAAPASFTVAAVKSPSSAVVENGSVRSGTFASLAAQDTSYFRINSTDPLLGLLGTATSTWYGRFTGVPKPLTSLKVTYAGSNTRTASQSLQVYRWTTGSWIQIDSRSVGTTEVKVADLAPSGAASDYVSSGGEVRVRVHTTNGSSFDSLGNLLQITFSS